MSNACQVANAATVARTVESIYSLLLWPPCITDADIRPIVLPCGFFQLSIFFFPRLISAVVDWMSVTLAHMVWP